MFQKTCDTTVVTWLVSHLVQHDDFDSKFDRTEDERYSTQAPRCIRSEAVREHYGIISGVYSVPCFATRKAVCLGDDPKRMCRSPGDFNLNKVPPPRSVPHPPIWYSLQSC